MPIKKIIVPAVLVVSAFLFFNYKNYGGKDDLDKRSFTTSVIEVKDGQNAKKSLPDEIEFKGGKLYSSFLNSKFQLKWLKYRINKDSVYMDENQVEVQYYEIEASISDEKDVTTIIKCQIEDQDIEGEIKMTKGDKPKKAFVFNGKEKYVKPKKK